VLSYWNNASAYIHVIGPVAIVLILIFIPDHHQSASFVFSGKTNASGFFQGHASGLGFWFYVLPLGFLLTQYTITGFDASAHLSEETGGAAKAAAQGLWRSIFYSAIGGWILLLCFTFAATNVDFINKNTFGFPVVSIFSSAVGLAWFKLIMVVSTIGQFFCGGSGLTSASRMMYAFSRDRAVPGHQLWSKVSGSRAPANATFAMAALCVLVAIPALKGNAANIPFAFLALTAVTVIGLYIAYVIPIYLRWRMGAAFQPGPWSLGAKYRWMCPIAIAEVIIVCIYFSAPFSPLGIPGRKGFAWDNGSIQYAPVVVFGVILLVGIWWLVSAKNWFTGPVRTIEDDPVLAPAAGD
jgi:amino acid transporter